jgi:hypothetical protein
MPVIRVDDEVMVALKQRGTVGDSFNDVVRDLLGLPRQPSNPTYAGQSIVGALGPLLRAGLLHEGQTVTWYRPRRGETHVATVDAHGRLATADGFAYQTPNAAASAVSCYPCLGWHAWRTADGATLADLRQRLDKDPPDGTTAATSAR